MLKQIVDIWSRHKRHIGEQDECGSNTTANGLDTGPYRPALALPGILADNNIQTFFTEESSALIVSGRNDPNARNSREARRQPGRMNTKGLSGEWREQLVPAEAPSAAGR